MLKAINHPKKVKIDNVKTTGAKIPDILSAIFSIGALLVWASSTTRTICANAVSFPTLVIRTYIVPA